MSDYMSALNSAPPGAAKDSMQHAINTQSQNIQSAHGGICSNEAWLRKINLPYITSLTDTNELDRARPAAHGPPPRCHRPAALRRPCGRRRPSLLPQPRTRRGRARAPLGAVALTRSGKTPGGVT